MIGIELAGHPRHSLSMKNKFYLGVGIENCWMVQTDHPGTRALDAFQQMEHYERWKEDLQLAVDLGTNAIRYSVPVGLPS